MTRVWVRPEIIEVARGLPLVFDLDGVVVDVRATYRRAYGMGVAWVLKQHGIAVRRGGPFPVAAVHALRRHPGFNAPADTLAFLLRAALVEAVRAPGQPVTGRHLPAWIAAALATGQLDAWREALAAELLPGSETWVAEREDVTAASRATHEAYAGSDAVLAMYGHVPVRRLKGLQFRDRLLLDPQRPPPPRPLAVYTGRTHGEALSLLNRFKLFRDVPADCIETTDTGARKPDPAPLLRLDTRLGGRGLVYLGDTEADRQTVLAFRRERPGVPCVCVQVVLRARAGRWPEADLAGVAPDSLLDALDP